MLKFAILSIKKSQLDSKWLGKLRLCMKAELSETNVEKIIDIYLRKMTEKFSCE